jgi:hypothetical protein
VTVDVEGVPTELVGEFEWFAPAAPGIFVMGCNTNPPA